MKKCVLTGLLLALMLCATACRGASPAPTPALDAPAQTPAPSATVQAESSQQAAAAFQAPCIEAPYDYQYLDEEKQIAIRRFSRDGITYFVADVQLTSVSQFQTALSGDSLAAVSAMAQRSGATLAINADDYGVHEYGTIIRNGTLLRAHDTTRNMLIVDENGDFSVRVDRANEDPAQLGQQLMDANVWQTFEFGPELIRDGQAVEFSPDFDVISTNPNRREPRTAIGQIGPLHYAVVVADGRQDGYSAGMTLPELQALFLELGAHTAMNLDGGGSAEIWFQGEVISQPSGGRERGVSDILFF